MGIAAGPALVNDPVIVWPSGESDQKISLPAPSRLATRPLTPVKAKHDRVSQPAAAASVPLVTPAVMRGVPPPASRAASSNVTVRVSPHGGAGPSSIRQLGAFIGRGR